MFTPFKKQTLRFAQWFKARAHGRHARTSLLVLSFSEAIFFPLPIDPFLIAILLAGAGRWIYYAALTTVASVLGGVVGYGIGLVFFDTVGIRIVEFYRLSSEMATVHAYYDRNAFLAIFLGAFTPLPYKIFVLSGGFFKIDFLPFLFASIVGRGLRYGIVAWLTARFGAHVVSVFLRYFNVVTVAALIILGTVLFYTLF